MYQKINCSFNITSNNIILKKIKETFNLHVYNYSKCSSIFTDNLTIEKNINTGSNGNIDIRKAIIILGGIN